MSIDQRAPIDTRTLLVVTPAHNEEGTLEKLADSMLDQSRTPDLWVIVDDRSSDRTWEIARSIADRIVFAHAVQRVDRADDDRNFGAKVRAFHYGYDATDSSEFAFVACVDADVALPSGYFERIVREFDADASLGVTGGVYVDPHGNVGRTGGNSVPGPAQVFRREVFDEIGGFRPLRWGGEDPLACVHARKLGWSTRALEDLGYRHLRLTGTGGGTSLLRAAFCRGRQDWDIGLSPIFELARMVPRLTDKPWLVGVLARLAGYLYGATTRTRSVEGELVAFSRSEQRRRMLGPVRRLLSRP